MKAAEKQVVHMKLFSSVQSLSHVHSLWPHGCSMPGLSVRHQLPEFTQTHVPWVGDAIQPSHPLLTLFLPPSIFPSFRVFSSESALRIRWPEYWSFSISHSSEHSGLISFRMDWWGLLAVQGTLKSPLQHHCSKASFIIFSALGFLYLYSNCHIIHDYWKNHSFD